jgi:CDP-6-deoxy-D-xylo-4-hexulose-3-dehydrase
MPNSNQYPLSFSSWDNQEINALQAVINSGQFTMGPKVQEFEHKFAQYHGSKFAVMVNSGSSANLVAIASLFYKSKNALQAGDEVIVPALAWSTSYAPLMQYGLKIKVVDIDRETLNIDMAELRRAINPKTKMILAASILGNPAALEEIRALADQRGIIFLEDNCESLGARLNGQLTGTFGDLSTCSFFFAHQVSTMEGGIILTNDQELFALMRALRAHGWARDLPQTHINEEGFPEAYRFVLPGYNLRPLEFAGATGIEQIKKVDSMLKVRAQNASYFYQKFKQDKRFQLQKQIGQGSSYCFPMIIKPESKLVRKNVFDRLRKNGIEFRMITGGNIARHEVAKHLELDCQGDLPNANWIHDYGFFVGNGPIDLRNQIDHLHKTLQNV